MPISKKLNKIIPIILFVIILIFFSTLHAKNFDKFNKAESIADYFSGVVLLNQSKYDDSAKYLKRLDGLEKIHPIFSTRYLYSLINSGKYNQAFNYSKKMEREKQDSYESNLIIGIYHLKNKKFDISNRYFEKAKNRKSLSILDNYIVNSLYLWSMINDLNKDQAITRLNQFDNRFENLKKIQSVFVNCFFDSNDTDLLFEKLINDKRTDFSRYNYFYANYLNSKKKGKDAKKTIQAALERYPRNLLLNQYKIDLNNIKHKSGFNCKKENNVVAELIYISANALSSQSIYSISNFYLNLSKFLNADFHAFDTLLAENSYKINDYSNAKKIYRKLTSHGNAYKWYAYKQISRILIEEDQKKSSLNLLEEAYNSLPVKGLYETFDYAEFLKNNEKFKESIKYYTEILDKINKDHPLYSEATDGRGVAYERIGDWNKAEKDLLNSLQASPDQAYVINYLAYSWIEKGIKIEKSLKMLEKANRLKTNDPFIIDSLGWALFKLKRYEESKDYLRNAVSLLPADPTVNDHYGDVLWKTGHKIQARYYWNYVLNLKNTEKDLIDKIELKLIKGL